MAAEAAELLQLVDILSNAPAIAVVWLFLTDRIVTGKAAARDRERADKLESILLDEIVPLLRETAEVLKDVEEA